MHTYQISLSWAELNVGHYQMDTQIGLVSEEDLLSC